MVGDPMATVDEDGAGGSYMDNDGALEGIVEGEEGTPGGAEGGVDEQCFYAEMAAHT